MPIHKVPEYTVLLKFCIPELLPKIRTNALTIYPVYLEYLSNHFFNTANKLSASIGLAI